MNISPQDRFLSEIRDQNAVPIPSEKLAYFRARLRNRLHSYILKALDDAKSEGSRKVAQVDVARRLSKRPEQINRWLGAPGNWTLDTVSDLLLAVAGRELPLEESGSLHERRSNCVGPSWVEKLKVVGRLPPEEVVSQASDLSEQIVIDAPRLSLPFLSFGSVGFTIPNTSTEVGAEQ